MRKIAGFLILLLVVSLTVSTAAQNCLGGSKFDPKTGKCKCPGNQYWDEQYRKCVTPGDDPSGAVDRELRRQLMEEGQVFCLDGWCCPNESAYWKCQRSNHREGTGQCKDCFIFE